MTVWTDQVWVGRVRPGRTPHISKLSHRLHHFEKDSCRESMCLGASQQYSFFKRREQLSHLSDTKNSITDFIIFRPLCFLFFFVCLCILVSWTVSGNKDCQCSVCLSCCDRRAEAVTNTDSTKKHNH